MTWKLVFNVIDAENFGPLLLEDGVDGLEVLSDTMLCCYLEGDRTAAEALADTAMSLGASSVTIDAAPTLNWVQECSELLAPVIADTLRVRPTTSASHLPTDLTPESDIVIIPGMGFGTGHHESTRMALCLLQTTTVREMHPRRILDLGTGSGILGIGAARLYGASVDAIDNDEKAIDNARENCELNGVTSLVTCLTGTAADAGDAYDGILANIYAEVLIELEPSLFQKARSGAFLILSGIMPHLFNSVKSQYCEARWREVEHRREGDWMSALLVKV